ncbi:hypothetical protein [Croceibacter atlanticus]|uniref:hypothetical protein n=1 Tax=Croceibacter atlanticus TaxID=313588 RepID=UPI0032B2B0FF
MYDLPYQKYNRHNFLDYLLKGFDVPMLKTGEPGVINVVAPNADSLAGDIRKAVIAYLKTL